MSWNKILGQKRAIEILNDIILRNRIPNAFLFYGNEGVGKDAIAIQFAKTLNCEKSNKNDIDENACLIDSCNQCKSCEQFDKINHPNFKIVFALPRGKNEKDTDDNPFEKLSNEDLMNVKEEIRKKAENHYYKISVPGASEIRLISIRDIRKSLSFSPADEKYRVVLLTNADEMNVESANAFLKILEEPPQKTLFILTTSRKDNILPTIISRCQEIFFDDLSSEDIENGLLSFYNVELEKAKIISRLAHGSFLTAINLLDENFNEVRGFIVDFLRLILSNKYQVIFSEIDKLIAEKDRIKIEYKLILLLTWLRDILLLRENLKEMIINIDQLDSLESFLQRLPSANVAASIEQVETTIQLLNKNVNLQLIFYNLIINLRRLILN